MAAFEVSRTLVKSPPEVWAELERAERLAELLGDDAIKITRAEPETTIEWQGSTASGTIEIGASGWGTKVRLTAEAEAVAEISAEAIDDPEPESNDVESPETAEITTPEPVGETSFWRTFRSRFSGVRKTPLADVKEEVSVERLDPEPNAMSEPEITTESHIDGDSPASERPVDFEARLTAVLDHLGSAHKRPFTAS